MGRAGTNGASAHPAPMARTINNYSLAAWKYSTTVRTNGFASGGSGTSPAQTVSTAPARRRKGPCRRDSGLTATPLRSTPAKQPLLLDQVSSSDCSLQFVEACALRPPGPPQPTHRRHLELAVQQVLESPCHDGYQNQIRPCRRSEAPGTASIRINTGALPPRGLRQVTTPWPYSAPKTNAPFSMPGTTPTTSRWRRIESGICLSGVANDLVQNVACRVQTRVDLRLCPGQRAGTVRTNVQSSVHRTASLSFV